MNNLLTQSYLSSVPQGHEKVRLFCFPYAGGGAKVFREWTFDFPDSVGVYPVQYPGRENRMSEQAIDQFDTLLDEIFTVLKPFMEEDVPYMLYGHSLGTKIAYELAKKAELEAVKPPEAVVVSAGRAPHLQEPNPIYHLSDDAFIGELRRFSGTPEEILENRDIMNIFLPMLRADFMIDETYKKDAVETISAPIVGIMGSEDQEMTLDELKAWREFTTSDFQYETVDGPHLFLETNRQAVTGLIQKFIEMKIG